MQRLGMVRSGTVATVLALALATPLLGQDATLMRRSSVSMGGAMDRAMGLAARLGAGSTETTETQYIKGTRIRTDSDGSSTIADLGSGRLTILDHDARTYMSIAFDSMMASAAGMAEEAGSPLAPAREGGPGPGADDVSWNVSVERPGDREDVAGYPAERVFITVEMDMAAVSQEELEGQGGRMVVFTEMWVSRDVPGQTSLESLGSEYASSAQATGTAMMAAFARDPGQRAGLERAAEEMSKVEGMPVRTTTHLVMVPPESTFDRRQALQGEGAEGEGEGEGVSAESVARGLMGGLLGRGRSEPEPEEQEPVTQVTILRVMEELVEVETGSLPESLFEVPEGYTARSFPQPGG